MWHRVLVEGQSVAVFSWSANVYICCFVPEYGTISSNLYYLSTIRISFFVI